MDNFEVGQIFRGFCCTMIDHRFIHPFSNDPSVMQPRSYSLELIESHNPFPDCLCLELEATPLQPQEMAKEWELFVSLTFNEQWQNLLGGRIKLGIKGGRLDLSLEQGQFSRDGGQLAGKVLLSRPLDLPQHSERSLQITPQWENGQRVSWQFGADKNHPQDHTFVGLIPKISLGTVTVTGENPVIVARFQVSAADLTISDAEGLWRHDLTPNKHAILERAIAHYLHKYRINGDLSWSIFGPHPLEKPDNTAAEQQALERLEVLLGAISNHNSDRLEDLAAITELDLKQDFAGGNFLGINGEELNINEGNLERANFRGATLTDADLSEANLTMANLGGVDLSGAYLEGATLTRAYLHNGSLALANLIGADLTEADLTGVNLSQCNLSRTTVTNTIFQNNVGLTPELATALKNRGAKVIDPA